MGSSPSAPLPTPAPVASELVAHLVCSNRYGVFANVAGAAIYTWLLWPIGSRPALATWLAAVVVTTAAHRFLLARLARRTDLAAWWRLAPTLGLVGLLWGSAPIMCQVREFSTPRGAMVVVFAACVAANGVVALAAFPQLFLLFAGPIMALTSVTYLTTAPTEVRVPVALGTVVMFVVFVAYNRQAHTYLASALRAHELLRDQADRHHHDATHDQLTGLLNRAGLLEALGDETAPIVFFDLDGFKQVNDLYGHAAGDRVLQVVGHRLASRIRHGDLCARLGGDEFVVALRDRGRIPGPPASRLAAVIAEPITFDDESLAVTASFGIAEPRDAADTIAEILHRSDRAMYEMKRRRTTDSRHETVSPASPWL